MSDQTDDLIDELIDELVEAAQDYRWARELGPAAVEKARLDATKAELRASLRASREQVATLQEALAEAAREIPCAGPVAHRIRVLRQEHAATVARLTEENDRLRSLEALHAKQADAANGEVARLTAERDDARAALDRVAETVEQMPRIGFNSTRDSIGPYLRRSAVLEAVRSAARLGSDSEDPTHG